MFASLLLLMVRVTLDNAVSVELLIELVGDSSGLSGARSLVLDVVLTLDLEVGTAVGALRDLHADGMDHDDTDDKAQHRTANCSRRDLPVENLEVTMTRQEGRVLVNPVAIGIHGADNAAANARSAGLNAPGDATV